MSIVETNEGTLEGFEKGGVHAFLGVRYAEPPAGERRFLPPAPVEPWSGVRSATDYGNRAWQGPLPPGLDLQTQMGFAELPGPEDEDCLFLNLWTPGPDRAARPVLVWFHGGSLQFGSANDYEGAAWATQEDIVVVTVGYRLGVLGFADLSACGPDLAGSASNGIRDQIEALRWVRRNIAAFGGDPGNVTIIGQSAGASSVLAIIASPAADGLYHKAVANSSGGVIDPPADAAAPLAAMLGTGAGDLLARLRAIPAADLVPLGAPLVPGAVTVDGAVVSRPITRAIRERGASGVPLLTGINNDEGVLFTAMPGFDQIAEVALPSLAANVVGAERAAAYLRRLEAAHPDDDAVARAGRLFDDLFLRSAVTTAEATTDAGLDSWLYRFHVPATRGPAKGLTPHGVEVDFTFNGPASGRPMPNYDNGDPAVAAVAAWWSHALGNFARSGDPNGDGVPEWPNYDLASRPSLLVGPEPEVERDLGGDRRSRWE